MKHIALYILLAIPLCSFSQDIKRTAIWYFGENAGIDFNTNPPTPLTNGKVNTIEGCASICDTAGNLLFYTDGRTVWNRYHDTMVNGTGLKADESSTQAALIVPKPETDSIYYIFTTSPNFSVSEVNINLNNGLGEIISKNKILITPIGEKQTATKHANGVDYWVITHGAFNDEYYAYLITKYGVSGCPVVSKVGTDFSNQNWFINQGSMKANLKGTKIATCLFNNRTVELFDFDAQSGIIDSPIQINVDGFSYGLEFSSNDTFLYILVRDKYLLQYNISSNKEAMINATKKIIFNFPPVYGYKIQLTIDKKIYLSKAGSQLLAIINKPNLPDTLCDFKANSFDLSPQKSLYGLPDFVTSFFYQPSIDFKYNLDCKTNTIDFIGNDTINATNYKWYFTKGNTTDSAIIQNPTYTFTDTGNYLITFIASNGNRMDTVTKNLYIHPKYSLNLGNDTIICSTPYTLNAGTEQFCYTWQDSNSNTTFEVTKSGTYNVKVVTNNFCIQFDTIQVTVANPLSKPIITRQNDTLISSPSTKYKWYLNNTPIPNANGQTHKVLQNCIYKVEITDTNGCTSLSENFNFIYLGINTISNPKQFNVYPNSAKNQLYIQKPQAIAEYEIKLLDLQGKALITKQLFKDTEEIELTTIAEGIYLLQITINGKLQETHKLIKQQ